MRPWNLWKSLLWAFGISVLMVLLNERMRTLIWFASTPGDIAYIAGYLLALPVIVISLYVFMSVGDRLWRLFRR
jgi:hypothetical protein